MEANRASPVLLHYEELAGRPRVSHEVIVNLIAATTTRTGLRVQSRLDTSKYPKWIKVGKQEFAAIQLRPDTFHGEWNYTITPRS
jgi:hypothetical protein